jgi:hypothetical protein
VPGERLKLELRKEVIFSHKIRNAKDKKKTEGEGGRGISEDGEDNGRRRRVKGWGGRRWARKRRIHSN